MNSSISSSEAARAGGESGARAWTRFALLLVGAAAALAALLVAFLYVIDPYDTGRPGWISKPGVRPQGPRTAAASRGRDPAFNAAIFGNSHVQLLSPERLSAGTGLAFVSLIAPATHPREQLALMDWFARHHPGTARAIIIGVDGNWCTPKADLPNEKPFPFWLYERSALAYAAGLMRFDILEEASRRIDWLRKRNPERARPDGYWDYEPNYIGLGYDVRPDRRAILEKPEPAVPANPQGVFPAARKLEAALAGLDPAIRVILVAPPVYRSALPVPGSALARADEACKAAFSQVAAARAGTHFLDMRKASLQAQDAGLWFDHTHYRAPIARQVEQAIASVLRPAP
jgi:hypothetical protein